MVLKVTDNIGETDTDTCVVVVVNSAPTSQFTFSPVSPTIFDPINFTETSTDIDGTISSWQWDFGDGTTSVERNPSHQYSQTGTYQISLTVTDDEGEENTKTASITVVNLAPTADFSCSKSSEILMNEPIQFTDNSTDPEDAIVSWLWDFGDGETSTVQNPSHEFENSGEHLVTLIVTDEDGSTDTASLTVNVNGNVEPTANFVCDNTEHVAGNEIVFLESSTDQDGNIATWNWDFGDGKTSTQQNPSHKYDRPGEYIVTLTVTDNIGAQDTYTTTITIQPSFMEQYMLLIVVGILAVVVIAAVAIGKRRRKNTLQIEGAPQSD